MKAIEDYIRTRIEDELRKRDRWLVDCRVCGEPYVVHADDGSCTRDPATYAKPQGIRTGR